MTGLAIPLVSLDFGSSTRPWHEDGMFPRDARGGPMSAFLHQLIIDMRSGRDSWRVVAIFSAISFAIAVLVQP
jgi:hypothetical protein